LPETGTTSRPHCGVCGVDMWLTRVGADAAQEAYQFECKVCGAQQVVLADAGTKDSVEDGL